MKRSIETFDCPSHIVDDCFLMKIHSHSLGISRISKLQQQQTNSCERRGGGEKLTRWTNIKNMKMYTQFPPGASIGDFLKVTVIKYP